MERTYWAKRSIARKTPLYGPFATRIEAIKAAFAAEPKTMVVTSGYGSDGPWFDIQWSDRERFTNGTI